MKEWLDHLRIGQPALVCRVEFNLARPMYHSLATNDDREVSLTTYGPLTQPNSLL